MRPRGCEAGMGGECIDLGDGEPSDIIGLEVDRTAEAAVDLDDDGRVRPVGRRIEDVLAQEFRLPGDVADFLGRFSHGTFVGQLALVECTSGARPRSSFVRHGRALLQHHSWFVLLADHEDHAGRAEDPPPDMAVAAADEPISCSSFEHSHTVTDLSLPDQPVTDVAGSGSIRGPIVLYDVVTNNANDIENYDLIIVGSGSGNSIPEYLADWKIALVERGTFGGTCLNVGCIPSKMFVVPADKAIEARNSAKLGIDTQFNGADWGAIRDRVFGRIDPISDGGRDYRASGTPNVTLVEGTAMFVGEKLLDVEGRLITAPNILVAAGARPVTPPIPGLVETGFHTSDSIMRLDDLPERLGIIGGGFIAVEMGHVFSGLGSEVTLFNRSNGLLRGFDGEIAARFTEVFGERVDLRLGHVPTRVARRDDGRIAITVGGEDTVVDELLVATGREPNSDLLDVEAAGLECHHHGTVKVDDTMATNVPGIWAIGDVANSYQLKHVANAEASVAFWNIAHPDDIRSQSYKAIPGAVFSNPQVASVGMTEEQATDAGLAISIGRRDYAGTAYGWALVDETSFAKVIVNTETGLFVGAHIIGPHSATLIQPIIQAMELDTPAAQVARAVLYIHPALTEVVENAILDALVEPDLARVVPPASAADVDPTAPDAGMKPGIARSATV